MGWIYRDAEQHKCPKPQLLPHIGELEIRVGDVWQCDCGLLYVVREDQRDGPYWTVTPIEALPLKIQALLKDPHSTVVPFYPPGVREPQ